MNFSLQLPNEMFYDDELEACADLLKRESLSNWSRLPCKGFPIIFEGITGRDMREEKSPSFFNPEEAAVVVQYVKDLKEARGISVRTSEIGVISPYRKQARTSCVLGIISFLMRLCALLLGRTTCSSVLFCECVNYKLTPLL